MSKEITLNDVKENDEFKQLINASNNSLKVLGYTEHGLRHVGYVSKTTANILSTLGFPQRTVELGAIAGWIHDIGNAINRKHHGLTGSLLAYDILVRMGMEAGEVALIISAIGNHEEETGTPVNEVAAALILADKSDAHRSRVRRNRRPQGYSRPRQFIHQKELPRHRQKQKDNSPCHTNGQHVRDNGIFANIFVAHGTVRKSRGVSRILV